MPPLPINRQLLTGSPAVPVLYGADGQVLQLEREGDAFDRREPSPGRPLTTREPPGAEPRRWNVWQGFNLAYVPRTEGGLTLTPFSMLRTLADVDIVRIIIEDLKGQLAGFDWAIDEDEDVSQDLESDCKTVRQMLAYPDGEHDFRTWLSLLGEEILVTDALSVYRWRRKNGEPYGLLALDGSTVKPLVDYRAISPKPPAPAYQQIILGRPETQFTRPWGDSEQFDPEGNPKYELCYRPRHPRAHTPYGQSPVERIIMTVNLFLRRQMHYLAFYTDGTIPESFWKVHESWTGEQITEWQSVFDLMLSGDSPQRSRMRFMPGGEGAGLENPRGHDEWTYEFDEFLFRVAAWAFNVSPLPIAKMMNRATSEQADLGATDSGLRPLMKFVEDFLTRQVKEFYGYPQLCFKWTEGKQEDDRLKFERNSRYVELGILEADEVRKDDLGKEALGYGPLPARAPAAGEAPAAPAAGQGEEGAPVTEGTFDPSKIQRAFFEVGFITRDELRVGFGLPPLGGELGSELITIGGAAGGAKGPQVEPSNDDDDNGGAAAVLDSVPKLPAAAEKAAREDLRRWRKVALKAVATGAQPRRFESQVIPRGVYQALAEWLDHASHPEDVEWGFRVLAKARRPLIAARRRIRHERRLRRVLREHFKAHAGDVAQAAVKEFRRRAEKAVGTPALQKDDDDLIRALNFEAVIEPITVPLEDAYRDGETVAAGAADVEGMFGLTDQAATEYAANRAAELVGMKRLEDGTLVPNPNAKWSVPDNIRQQLQTTITKALDEGWTENQLKQAIEKQGFWNWRAEMIARTETAYGMNAGTVDTYKGAGIKKVRVLDGPGCQPEGHDDATRGVSGETWTLGESSRYPIGHPNCRRDFSPIAED